MADILILDGGMGRELERIGAPFRQPEWSALALMEAPDMVRKVHDSYIRAGAKVITTNSYAIVPFHIGEARFRERGEELAALAGRLARDAAGATNVKVAGSLPPVFGSYQPELFNAELAADYLGVLVRGMSPYVDFWLAETQSSLEEATAAATSIRQTGKPLWLSFTLRDDIPSEEMTEPQLRSHQTVADAARLAAALGAEALLFNCSMPEVMAAALRAARAAVPLLPLGVYANAFGSQDEDGAANEVVSAVRTDLDAQSYCNWGNHWIEAGATIIGGCCGIGTDHIHHLTNHLVCEATR
ncbi:MULTISPECIES: homocysteine S-methyltransferase family protein [Rhizobium]|uniref:Homocysteine S-methyltransferase family protein n=1 Tax=Rhizobium rhododendri TaxID=2506430 RepID=A0ABY8IPI1_9HYPH|nr:MULTISPECIES: homocysteine S-methyltransferase family protein [Rhizobium]MBO9135015.1 homocysteine S-methyltransferase family protein [Rhizobium sp. B209b/85]MBO9171038.1 homocysteine S-methyltransferase family protein [Rhizobium sp. L245/93]QXZ81064.1 homocysteine S-methyltransferase family protein [Rhizobium sp. L51/94]QXZ98065.1 homocysteine S-methyltransferase family protein [Rhizobium sp. B230/85]QYA03775.1 homocysteine S-methyltransferase family protein [Rhizobium sp. B21/90]